MPIATDDPATNATEGNEPNSPDLTVRRPLASRAHHRRLLAGALVLAVLVAATAVAWRTMTRNEPLDDRAAAASERDAAQQDTIDALEKLLSADHRDAAVTLDSWSDATTGRLHARVVEQRSTLAGQIRRNKEKTRAKVVEVGLASWDSTAGTARLLAVLELDTQSNRSKSGSSVVRYLAMAQRVDGEWRLSAVQQLGDVS